MLKRITTVLLVVVCLLVVAAPARAADPVAVTDLPEIRGVNSARFDTALAINKIVLSYAKGEFSGDNLHAVAVDAIDGTVIEVVVVGNDVYTREGNNPKFTKSSGGSGGTTPVSGPASPNVSTDPTVLGVFLVGDATVNGVATSQYQIALDPTSLSLPSDLGVTALVIDLFIGKSDSYLYKTQTSLRGTDVDIGDYAIEDVTVYSDFNTAIAVGAPTADRIQASTGRTAAARTSFAGSRYLPSYLRPIVARHLNNIKLQRHHK